MIYTPESWFWKIADKPGYWSSGEAGYVKALPKGAVASRIASEDELFDVLAAYGLQDRAPDVGRVVVDRVAQLESRIEALEEKGLKNGSVDGVDRKA